MALELTLAFFAFWFCTRPGQISYLFLTFLVAEDNDYVDDDDGDEEVLQLITD